MFKITRIVICKLFYLSRKLPRISTRVEARFDWRQGEIVSQFVYHCVRTYYVYVVVCVYEPALYRLKVLFSPTPPYSFRSILNIQFVFITLSSRESDYWVHNI